MAADTSFEIEIDVLGSGSAAQAAGRVAELNAQLKGSPKRLSDAEKAIEQAMVAYRKYEKITQSVNKQLEANEVKQGQAVVALKKAQEAGDTTGAAKLEKTLAKLNERQEALKAKSEAFTRAMGQQADKVALLRKEMAKGALSTGDRLQAYGKQLASVGGLTGALGLALSAVGSRISDIQERGKALASAIGKAFAVIGEKAALTIATVGALGVAFAGLSVHIADQERTNRALMAGFTQNTQAGNDLYDTIKSVQNSVPISADEIRSMGQTLGFAGLKGEALRASLQYSAEWAARIKYGPDWEKQTLSLTFQTERLKRLMSSMFDGFNIEGVLRGFRRFVDLFDQSTASGRAMQAVLSGIFGPITQNADAFSIKLERLFIQGEILVLKFLIRTKEIRQFFADVVSESMPLFLDGLKTIGIVAALALGGIALMMGIAVVGIDALTEGAWALVDAFQTLPDTLGQAFEFFDVSKWVDLGGNIILGIIDGIANAGGAVADAVQDSMQGALDKTKAFLGIHSPSTKYHEEVGQNIGLGVAGGVEAAAPAVSNSLETITAPPSTPPARGAEGKALSTGTASHASGARLENVVFNFHGVQGAEDAVDRLKDALTAILEGDVAQLSGVSRA